jgi:nucleotide-binding universal stress UspA family protein
LRRRAFRVTYRANEGSPADMRIYLVVVDDSPEAEVALRFAARRAVKTGGGVEILSIMAPQEFIAFGGVQATIEAEARQHAEAIIAGAAGTLFEESGLKPAITLKQGDGPKVIRETIEGNPEIAALVLGAAPSGSPGPLVSHFAGSEAGTLPVPIMVIPGSLDREAIDRLS